MTRASWRSASARSTGTLGSDPRRGSSPPTPRSGSRFPPTAWTATPASRSSRRPPSAAMTSASIQVLRSEQHRRMPWRNGGGVTYEVASSPPGADLADFDWRISIADVETGGPFSAFPDVDRTITLLEGEWMALPVGGRGHRFGLREPVQFDCGRAEPGQGP